MTNDLAYKLKVIGVLQEEEQNTKLKTLNKNIKSIFVLYIDNHTVKGSAINAPRNF